MGFAFIEGFSISIIIEEKLPHVLDDITLCLFKESQTHIRHPQLMNHN